MNETAGTRIAIVDDHPVVRDGVSLLLAQKGFVVCGEADNCADALLLAESSSPNVMLIDLSLAKENGLDLIHAVHTLGVKILVYSMYCDARHIKAALALGAHGYVTKREVASTLVDAIQTTLSDGRYLSPLAAEAMAGATARELPGGATQLSEREGELFLLLGEGYTATDLADHFGISYSTVQTYYVRIMEKLGVTGAKELRRLAITYKK
jgi:DNA-binding NarL/FixJ family response regulator